MIPDGAAEKRFKKLQGDRDFYLQEAKISSSLTIPSLFPPDINPDGSSNAPQNLPSPYQSFGAYAVESLSSKFLMATFPPSSPWFRYEISERSLEEARTSGASEEEITQLRGEVAKALSYRESAIQKYFDASNLRVVVAEALRHLVTGGNALLWIPTDGSGSRLFSLSRYVVRRGPMGRVMELVIRETFDFDGLPADIRALAPYSDTDPKKYKDTEISVYTHLELDVDKKRYTKYQEVWGQRIPGSEGSFPEDNSPYIPLRFTTVEGESYGRGYVENYRGSLNSLEVLRRSILENSASAARALWLVRPNGTTKVRNLAKAANGAFITGDVNDVACLRQDKQADLSVAQQAADTLVKELEVAFLLGRSVSRPGERVTATEVRALAMDLDNVSGAVWSTLARECQLPIVRRIEQILEKQREITSLPKGTVQPTVIGGLAAIGRDTDMNKLRELTADFANAASVLPEVVQYLEPSVIAEKIVLGHSVPSQGLLKTPAQVQQEQQAAQQAAMQQQMVQEASKAAPGLVEQAVQQGGMSETE